MRSALAVEVAEATSTPCWRSAAPCSPGVTRSWCWAGLGEGALPQGVLAIGAVSPAQLFPRLAAVIYQGGAGTTRTGARTAV